MAYEIVIKTFKRILKLGASYSIERILDEYTVTVDYKQVKLSAVINEDELHQLGIEIPSEQ